MKKEIRHQEILHSYIIFPESERTDLEFYSPTETSLQLGYMKKNIGEKIQPHRHQRQKRIIYDTQEILFVVKGRLIINYYDNNNYNFHSEEVYEGCIIHLICGGHGFEFIEKSELYEVKQGPYLDKIDKVRF